MHPALAVDLMHTAMLLTFKVAAPMLLTALLVGVLVSLVQAITQIQEQTLAFIPKLVAIGVVMMISLPWMLGQLRGFLVMVLGMLPSIAQ